MQLSPLRLLKDVKQYDERRPGFAGEHWLVLGARRSPSPWRRSVGSALGSALLYRAASGRDGLAKVMRWLPLGR